MAKRQKTLIPEETGCVIIHSALKPFFTYRFYKLALRLRAQVNEGLEKVGLIGPQLGLLRVLQVEGPASQISLGRGMGVDKATMVKLLDDLEKKGLVQRVAVAGDRRVKHIRVTAKGARRVEEGGAIRQKVEDRFFSVLSAAERDALDRTLTKLLG